MSLIRKTAVLGLFLVTLCNGYEGYLPNSKHPDVNDKCLLKETGDFIEFDQSITPTGICARYTCRDDFVIQVDVCSRYMQPLNCEILSSDLKKSFPECCPKLKCIDNDGNIDIRSTTG